MDLLAFERKLDQTIMRKRVDIQEALKRPMKVATRAGRLTLRGRPVRCLPSANACGFSPPSCQQQKRKLRLYISNTFNPARPDADDSDGSIASWELRVEGKLLDDVSSGDAADSGRVSHRWLPGRKEPPRPPARTFCCWPAVVLGNAGLTHSTEGRRSGLMLWFKTHRDPVWGGGVVVFFALALQKGASKGRAPQIFLAGLTGRGR